MADLLQPPASVRFLALAETDRLYFELGAERHRIGPAQLACMPSLSPLGAACVATHLAPDARPDDLRSSLPEIETFFRDHRFPTLRIYTASRSPWDAVLEPAGLEAREEIGFISPSEAPSPEGSLDLRAVEDASAWERKLVIHEASDEQPDGHAAMAKRWVQLEQTKCETGQMWALLACQGETAVGTVCGVHGEGLLRLKNIVVHPQHRRRGLGTELVLRFWALARERGYPGIGVFAVGGGAGERLYRRCGLLPDGSLFEWQKSLA